MLKKCRQKIINSLWQRYFDNSSQTKLLEKALLKHGIMQPHLDHFAVIDLPGPNTGIYHMREIFTALGFVERGADYLAEKQNDFAWLCENDAMHRTAIDVLPQVVIADFRLDILPPDVKKIIIKYSSQAYPTPVFNIKKLAEHINRGDNIAIEVIHAVLMRYFAGRDWPLPTVKEYELVKEFNELLAWVLVFGRKPNHFTFSIHLMNHFNNLAQFARFIEDEVQLELNREGGVIKGGKEYGIEQGATQGSLQRIKLSDGEIDIPMDFVEFVWRHPIHENKKSVYWDDYFSGFIAKFANRVIESLKT